MARYFYTNGCRRKFILEYFGQIPKFFCCNNCDNCCERELIDYTKKIKKVVFKNKEIKDIFNENELEILEKNNLVKCYKSNYVLTDVLKKWKKTLEVNNKVKNIPEKYNIKLV